MVTQECIEKIYKILNQTTVNFHGLNGYFLIQKLQEILETIPENSLPQKVLFDIVDTIVAKFDYQDEDLNYILYYIINKFKLNEETIELMSDILYHEEGIDEICYLGTIVEYLVKKQILSSIYFEKYFMNILQYLHILDIINSSNVFPLSLLIKHKKIIKPQLFSKNIPINEYKESIKKSSINPNLLLNYYLIENYKK